MRSRGFLITLILVTASLGPTALIVLVTSMVYMFDDWMNPVNAFPTPNVGLLLFLAALIVITPIVVLWWLYLVFNVFNRKIAAQDESTLGRD